MSTVLQFGLLGLGAGAVYALMASGVVLIYKGTGVLNFAQGAYAMGAAYAFFELRVAREWNPVAAFVVCVLAAAVLGAATYQLVMRPLRHASTLIKIVATLGVLAVLQGAATIRYGGNLLTVPEVLPASPINVLGVTVIENRLWLLVIACTVTSVLYLVSRFTPIGLATTAAAENERAAAALGWSPHVIALTSWALGTGLAGAAGILIVPITGLQGASLTLLVVVALAAGLLGGFLSYPLTLFAGLAIGATQSIVGVYVSTQGVSASIPFAVVIVVLVIRGRGLPSRGHVIERLPAIGSGKRHLVPLLAAFGVVGVGLMTFFSVELVIASTVLMTSAVIILSIVVLTGYAGQLSLGQFALAGIGALIAGRAVADLHFPLLAAILVGVVGTMPIGMFFALPALRTRGVTLGVVTLGLGITAQAMIFQSDKFSGGLSGISIGLPSLFGQDISALIQPRRYALFCLVALLLACLVVGNVRRSTAGRRLISIRTNERAAASLGVSVMGSKLFAFAISSALAALGGILVSFQSTNIILGIGFDPLSSITGIGNAVIGGVGYASAALVGGTFVTGSPGTLVLNSLGTEGDWLTLIGGVMVIVTLLTNEDGVMGGLVETFHRKLRRSAGPSPITAAVRAGAAPVRVAPAQLVVRDMMVRFGGVVAVDQVSFSAGPGEVLGLIGPNGAGKTTIIDAITGFVRNRSGAIEMMGEKIDSWPVHKRARKGLCRSFQSLELFDDLTVLDNLRAASDTRALRAYATSVLPLRPEPLSNAAVAAIHEFGLADDLDRLPTELPYGRRRLVGIARSVATSPSVLLLDEPAAGLDEHESAQLAHLIRRLAEEWGMCVILVEHDMSLVMDVCDQVVVLEFGRKIAEGTPAQVCVNPAVIKAYLGSQTEAESSAL